MSVLEQETALPKDDAYRLRKALLAIISLKEDAYRLRKALLAIIGVVTEEELLQAKDLIELTKSDANRAAILNAINILLDTMPKPLTSYHLYDK